MPAPTSPAGYSGTPLPRKLGIKPGAKVLLVTPPPGLHLGPLPADVRVDVEVDAEAGYDVALFFTTSRRQLAARFGELTARLAASGSLWVCWPKRASGAATDMTENVVRDTALPRGWVDNKVCAVDATWSGLRLVLRVENRPKLRQT
jgi:hypothetical protein